MQRLLVLLSVLFISTITVAQSISGKVLDPDGTPIPFANVTLLQASDSSLVKVEATDADGVYEIIGIKPNSYLLEFSYVGMVTSTSGPLTVKAGEKLQQPDRSLKANANELSGATVTAIRPILEVLPDKTVFNVDGSVNATGSNGLELLRKAPGVVVDNNENVLVSGKNGVRIFIDGRPSPLSGEDLAAFLKGMNSAEIDNIEIITNPSAKYESAGNAGIINIKLKKDKRFGANANINAGFAQGVTTRYNLGVGANYRNKALNVFGNINHARNDGWWWMHSERSQLGNELILDMNNYWKSVSNNFKIGADYALNDQHSIGVIASGFINSRITDGLSTTEIKSAGALEADSILEAITEREAFRDNYNMNLNYSFDNGKGKTLTMDLDYGGFVNSGDEIQPNIYKNNNGEEVLQENNYHLVNRTDINITTGKIDYEQPLLKGKVGVGAKVSNVITDNGFQFSRLLDNEEIIDDERTSDFEYTERVSAGYVTYSTQIQKKLNINVGLRAEHTYSRGILTAAIPTSNNDVERDTLNFFPSGGVSFQINRMNKLAVNYSRRLDRPSYDNLNPFEYRSSEISYRKGNPFLTPQYTNNFQLVHTYKYMFNTTLGYSKTVDMMAPITDTAGGNAMVMTQYNLGQQENISLGFSAPLKFAEWWSSFTNLSAYYLQNKSDQVIGLSDNIDLDVFAWNLYSQQTFMLPKDFSLEVSGWYNSGGIWGGTWETKGMGSLDLGVQKKIFNGLGNIKVGYTDVLGTAYWRASSDFGPIVSNSRGGWDSQRFKIDFTYFIGNKQVKVKQRKSGADDENKRVGGAGGGGIGG